MIHLQKNFIIVNDKYILGVTSSRPGILADTEDPTCSKYALDEWNREI